MEEYLITYTEHDPEDADYFICRAKSSMWAKRKCREEYPGAHIYSVYKKI